MGVILSLLPKQIVMAETPASNMSNFTDNKKDPEPELCVCGCGNNAGCCKPRRFNLAARRRARLRNQEYRNFALVDFLYTPNTPADFESATGNFRNCCGR